MDYLKKELNKLFPLALLFGALGGVLLILVGNVFDPNRFSLAAAYLLIITGSVYVLNKIRFRKDIVSSILYGFLVYALMTVIAYLDLLMNANPQFSNPLFEQAGFFGIIFAGSLLVSGTVVVLFRKQLIS